MRHSTTACNLAGNTLPQLSKEKVYELINDYQKTGSIKIRNKIINHNLALISKVSFKIMHVCKPKHLDREDLLAAGMEGLINSIEKFDIKLGFAFSTYAFNGIYQYMIRYLANNEYLIRLPIHLQREERLLRKEKDSLKQNNDPAKQKVSEITKTTEAAIKAKYAIDYIDQTEEDDRQFDIEDKSENLDISIYHQELKESVKDLLTGLTQKQAYIIRSRFGIGSNDAEPMSLGETCVELGITRERVRQIEKEVLHKFRYRLMDKEANYGREIGELSKILQDEETMKKNNLEKRLLSKTADIKQYLHKCYEQGITYAELSFKYNVTKSNIGNLAIKFDAGYLEWQKEKAETAA